MLIQAGGAEALVDDALGLAERARLAGVDVTLDVAHGMVHVWHFFAPWIADSRRAFRRLGAFVREAPAS